MAAPLFANRGPLSMFLDSIGSLDPDLISGIGPGDVLFHYTDLTGLKGIVEEHDLWLTHSHFLNDSEEMTHGRSVVRTVLDREKTKPVPDLPPQYIAEVEQLLADLSQVDVYICSLCRKDDLLSQWRAYGANGTGVSIKFEGHGFDFVTGPDSPPSGLMRLWRVFYDDRQQERIVSDALRFFHGRSASFSEDARNAVDTIQFFLPTFKNNCFKEEDECRLIFTPSPEFHMARSFRVMRGMLIPYFSLQKLRGANVPSQCLPIRAVTIGPSVNKELNRESVEWLLSQCGYASVTVASSAMPYRG